MCFPWKSWENLYTQKDRTGAEHTQQIHVKISCRSYCHSLCPRDHKYMHGILYHYSLVKIITCISTKEQMTYSSKNGMGFLQQFFFWETRYLLGNYRKPTSSLLCENMNILFSLKCHSWLIPLVTADSFPLLLTRHQELMRQKFK